VERGRGRRSAGDPGLREKPLKAFSSVQRRPGKPPPSSDIPGPLMDVGLLSDIAQG
jgi:hypothetical protein